ncbi:MAG: NAD-dependent [Geobacteraceae bacterium]|nr:MAG: NAD-dependent [Geobacteraceae bacterium]
MDVRTVLITGGAGFYGESLKEYLLERGVRCVSVDVEEDFSRHPLLTSVRGDIRDRELLARLAATHRFDAICHLAAVLAHSVKDESHLWSVNVDGTRNVAEVAAEFSIPKVIFTSSNCLWGEGFGRPVSEDDQPRPVEIYGRSKWEGEKILLGSADRFDVVVLRCPTIVAAGRLGLLAILFEFIAEGRRVWVVDGGRNRYQFISAADLNDACLRALEYRGSDLFNIGSDNVPTLAEAYRYVIDRAGTKARVASLPGRIALPLMRYAHRFGLSPLGPYQYKMIAESFEFDTAKIKARLGWSPSITNREMLWDAYRYYHDHLAEIKQRKNVSPHKKPASLGIIRLLKWLS